MDLVKQRDPLEFKIKPLPCSRDGHTVSESNIAVSLTHSAVHCKSEKALSADGSSYPQKCLQKKLKDIVNAWKSQLSDFDLYKWSSHTDTMNPAYGVVRNLKGQIGHNFVTNAWIKFWEILSSFPSLTAEACNPGTFKTVHICEAPGGFVSALEYFLRYKECHQSWKWIASSLHPHYEGNHRAASVTDDRFIMMTWENWYWCRDGTGDIMNKENIESLIQFCGPGQCQLVTADGSVNCSQDPGEQESTVVRLILSEVTAALGLLTEDGNFVVKMFTFFESSTVSILSLLSEVFRKVSVTKPAASKPGNSEVYVVCEGFRRTAMTDRLLERLLIKVSSAETSFIAPPELLSDRFLDSVKMISLYFANCQIEAIQRNLALWALQENNDDYEKVVHAMKGIQDKFTYLYLKKYDLMSVKSARIFPSSFYSELPFWGRISGCYRRRGFFSEIEKGNLNLFVIENLLKSCGRWEYELRFRESLSESNFESCKPFDQITNSKFVQSDLLEAFLFYTETKQKGTAQPFNIWCKNVCLRRCRCRTFINVKEFLAQWKRQITELVDDLEQDRQSIVAEDLQLLTRCQIGYFILYGSLFEEVTIFPSVCKVEFRYVRPNWEAKWQHFFESSGNDFWSKCCVRVKDVCSGLFLEEQHSQDKDTLMRMLTSYNECYILKYLKEVASMVSKDY